MANFTFGNCSVSLKGELLSEVAFVKAFAGKSTVDIKAAYKAYKSSHIKKK